MSIKLIIFFLGVQSSYSENIEVPAEEFGDTVQWIITDEKVWRVKTFALDQDVHPYLIAPVQELSIDPVDLAFSNTEKHYGDVIVRSIVLQTEAGVEDLRHDLAAAGLDPNLNVSPSGFLFWTPEGTNYSTKSAPRSDQAN